MGKYEYRTPMTGQRKARRKIYQYIAGHRAAGNYSMVKFLRRALTRRGDLLFIGGYYNTSDY